MRDIELLGAAAEAQDDIAALTAQPDRRVVGGVVHLFGGIEQHHTTVCTLPAQPKNTSGPAMVIRFFPLALSTIRAFEARHFVAHRILQHDVAGPPAIAEYEEAVPLSMRAVVFPLFSFTEISPAASVPPPPTETLPFRWPAEGRPPAVFRARVRHRPRVFTRRPWVKASAGQGPLDDSPQPHSLLVLLVLEDRAGVFASIVIVTSVPLSSGQSCPWPHSLSREMACVPGFHRVD